MPVDTQFSFSGGEVNPSIYGRADLQKFDVSCRTLKNMIVHPEGGASNRPGMRYVGAVHDSSRKTRLIPFRFNNEQTYVLEFGHQTMRVFKDEALVFEPAVNITAITQANPCELTIGSHTYVAGQEVYISGIVGMTELNGGFYRINSATATTITLEDIFGNNIDSTGYTSYTSGGAAEVAPVFTTVYDEDDLFKIKFTQRADTLTVTHPDYSDMYDVTRTDHHLWTVTAVSFTPSITAPTGLGVSAGTGTSITREYVVTVIDGDTGEESVASSSVSASSDLDTVDVVNSLSWSTVSGAGSYNIYCDDTNSGVYGYIGNATDLTFDDIYIEPDYTKTPPETNNPFNGSDNIPQSLTYHQQRRMYAGTNNKRNTFFASRIGQFTNMNTSAVTQADDSIEFNIVSDDVHEIHDMLSVKGLFLFTSSGVWEIATGESLVFSQDNISSEDQESWGVSSTVRALKVGNSMLYAQDGERVVRDLQYTFESDGYSGDELTLLAKHMFKNRKIKDWAYARDPDSIIWCVMDDGTVNALTYLRKHQVWAWHRHETEGVIESVASIPETTSEYGVYFVVKRTVNGQDMRYVERLAPREITNLEDAFIVDSGLSYSGSPTSTVSGLNHLEGETVSILADGGVETQAVVTDGSITIANAASTIHVGLPYTSDLETIGIDLTALNGYGDSIARKKCVKIVKLRLKDSVGLKIGSDADNLEEYKPDAVEADSAQSFINGVIEKTISPAWDHDGTVFIRQTDPLPLTILNIMPEVTVVPNP